VSARTAAEARGDLAERMLPVAAQMAMLVHGDGGPGDIAQVLAGLDDTERNALVVVLAGLVDPDRPIGAALGAFDYDHTDTPVIESWDPRDPVSSLAERYSTEADGAYVDQAAVEAYAAGRSVEVTKRERLEAIRAAVGQGLTYGDLDALHGLRQGSTSTFVSRARMTHQDWGLKFPEVSEPAAFSGSDVVEIRKKSADGTTDIELAMAYNVTKTTIGNIVTGVTYVRYGGPLREPKDNKPGGATRTLWAHTSPTSPLAEAS
jgi:hypothetical protein